MYSVKGCFLVAVYSAPETRFNLKSIFDLLISLDLTDLMNIFSLDFKVIFESELHNI